MLIVAGEIRTPERDQYLEAVKSTVAATLANDAGCQTYAFTPDPDDPTLLRLFEIWDNADCLRNHAQAPHMAKWQALKATLKVTEAKLTKYEVSSASPLG
jgi:quinol monooxygenase YgiN